MRTISPGSVFILAGLACLASHDSTAQPAPQLAFDGAEAPPGTRAFAARGSRWQGGRIRTEGAPALSASGAFFYEPGPGGAEARFDVPVTGLRFYYVHGFGVAEGTARAYAADGTELASTTSRAATLRAAPEGFTGFGTDQPVARVRFEGGVVDSVSWTAAPAATPTLDTGVNGAWLNTTQSPYLGGQGLLLEYLPGQDALFLAWFTFADAQADSAAQRWLVAQGPVAGGVATMTLATAEGGLFNAPPNVPTTPVGTMTLTLTACDRALVEYAIPGEASSGSFEITRARTVLTGDPPCGDSLAR